MPAERSLQSIPPALVLWGAATLHCRTAAVSPGALTLP
jgi:hypothetical protein